MSGIWSMHWNNNVVNYSFGSLDEAQRNPEDSE